MEGRKYYIIIKKIKVIGVYIVYTKECMHQHFAPYMAG